MDKAKRLEELLNNVSDIYPDFVSGALLSSERRGYVDKLIQLLENNPDITTSEILDKETEWRGIKKVCPPETEQAAK